MEIDTEQNGGVTQVLLHGRIESCKGAADRQNLMTRFTRVN